jgi:hypothetical protein
MKLLLALRIEYLSGFAKFKVEIAKPPDTVNENV